MKEAMRWEDDRRDENGRGGCTLVVGDGNRDKGKRADKFFTLDNTLGPISCETTVFSYQH